MSNTYHVLIVEDDNEQVELVTEFLRLSGDYTIDVARNLRSLWEKLAPNRYHILLMDYRLPDGTGLDALTQIAARGIEVPVVMVSGLGDERIAAQAIQRGAFDYLVKNGDHLLVLPAVIQKAIRAHQLQLSVKRSLEQIRYQALLLNNVRDAIVVWDTNNRITYWNPAAELLFGIPSTERIGKDARSCYLESFNPAIGNPDDTRPYGLEVERCFLLAAGGNRWVSSRICALHDFGNGGRLIGYMDICRDISERKKFETQVQTAQTHFAQSTRMAAIGELASGVAHQINNPLTTIIADAQLALQTLPKDHTAYESIEAIEQAGWRAQQVVQRLLDFSRPPSSNLGLIPLEGAIQRALTLIGANIQSNGISIRLNWAEKLPRIRGYERQLEDLWVTLLSLARDATADGHPHTITINTKTEGKQWVVVEIMDDGTPVPSNQIEKAFEPDFVESKIGRGTGIELSICREIVHQHQGQISLESDPSHGTIFYVRFPLEVQP